MHVNLVDVIEKLTNENWTFIISRKSNQKLLSIFLALKGKNLTEIHYGNP